MQGKSPGWEKQMPYLWWLPPCSITQWFVTFSGKDASCYCPNHAFWSLWNTRHTRRYTHICIRGALEELTASSDCFQIHHFLSSGAGLSFSAHCLIYLSQPLWTDLCHLHTHTPTHGWTTIELSWNGLYLPVFRPMTGQLTSVLTVNPTKNKQQLARRDSRKTFVFIKWIWREQVCFGGSGFLPLLPWALGRGPFQGLAGRVEKGGWLTVSWIHWQRQPPAQFEPMQLTDTAAGEVRLRPADVSHRQTTRLVLAFQTNSLPIAMALWTTTMENTSPCLCECLP